MSEGVSEQFDSEVHAKTRRGKIAFMIACWLCGVVCGALLVFLGAWLNERFGLLHHGGQTPGAQVGTRQPAVTPSYELNLSSPNFLVRAVKRVVPAVVCIRGYTRASSFDILMQMRAVPKELASGVIFGGDNGYIVTNQHILEGTSQWNAQLIDGRQFKLQKVAEDRHADIALLRIVGATSLPQATFGSSRHVEVGSWVIAVGNPYGKTHTVTVGIVSAKGRDIRDGVRFIPDVIQTDAPINPGNSGGPLCDVSGNVIGINTAINPQEWGIGYAIASDFVLQVIDGMLHRHSVRRPWLGVEYEMLADEERQKLGIECERAIIVRRVQLRSSAYRAGVLSGDIIVAINGEAIRDIDHLREAVLNAGVGGRLSLRIFRGGHYRDVTVKIIAIPLEQISDEDSWR